MPASQTAPEPVESTIPKSDRSSGGRFAKGNAGGPGNPFGRRLAQFRQALLSAVTEEHMRRVGELLVEQALAGDMAAVKLLLQYAVGKPQVVAEPDRVDIDEWELARQRVVDPEAAQATFASWPITVGIATLPALAEVHERQFVDMMRHPENYPNPARSDESTPEELAAELALHREFRAAQAAEQATAQRRGETDSPCASPSRASISLAASVVGTRSVDTFTFPMDRGQAPPLANRSSHRAGAKGAETAVPASDAGDTPLPNGTNGPRRRVPSGGEGARLPNARSAG